MRAKGILLQGLIVGVLSTCLAAAQDFERSYALPAGSDISIRNISGNIKIDGYDGETVIVTAVKFGRDRSQVEIVDASSDDTIDIHVRYPSYGNIEAAVEFHILAPRNMPYNYEDITSVSGDVFVSSAAGHARLQSVSGSIEIEHFFGSASASSVSGDVFVRLVSPVEKGSMRFSSISGDVVVYAPADLDAYIDMSTISGSLWTDFPLRISGRWPFGGRSVKGRLGKGTSRLTITSISGRVGLLVDR